VSEWVGFVGIRWEGMMMLIDFGATQKDRLSHSLHFHHHFFFFFKPFPTLTFLITIIIPIFIYSL